MSYPNKPYINEKLIYSDLNITNWLLWLVLWSRVTYDILNVSEKKYLMLAKAAFIW